MAQTIIAKNLTAGALPLTTLGVPGQEIPASGQVELTLYNSIAEIQENVELLGHIQAGDAILNIDGTDLTQAQSEAVVQSPVVQLDLTEVSDAAIGNRLIQATVTPAGGLDVNVTDVAVWQSGIRTFPADVTPLTLTDDASNYIYVDASADTVTSTVVPTGNFVLLSIIVTASGAIVSQEDIASQVKTQVFDAVVALDGTGDFSNPSDAYSAGAKNVFVRNGHYFLTSGIDIPDGGSLVGESKAGVLLDMGGVTGRQIRSMGSPTDISDDFYDGVGTIDMSLDSATVSGTLTTFLTAGRPVAPDDWLVIRGAAYQVDTVDTDLQLTLKTSYRGLTETGIAFNDYVILPLNANVIIRDISVTNLWHSALLPSIWFNQCLNSLIWNVDVSNSVSATGRTVELRCCVSSQVEKLSSLSAGAVVGIRNGWRCGISNSTLTGARNNSIYFANQTASLPSMKHTIANCTIEGSNAAGINLNQATSCLVIGNTVFNCGTTGINASSAVTGDHLVVGNHVSGCGTGISTGAASVFLDNWVVSSTGVGASITGSNTVFQGNVVENSGTAGISLGSLLSGVVLNNNIIRNSSTYGIVWPSLGGLAGIARNNAIQNSGTAAEQNRWALTVATRIWGNDGIADSVVKREQEVLRAPKAAGFGVIAQQGGDFNIVAGFRQPDWPRCLKVVFSVAWDGGDIQLDGIDARGRTCTEVITAAAGSTVQGAVPFALMSEIQNLGTHTAGTVDVQITDILGLVHIDTSVYKETAGGLDETVGTENPGEGTIQPTTAPDGATDFVVWYTYAAQND